MTILVINHEAKTYITYDAAIIVPTPPSTMAKLAAVISSTATAKLRTRKINPSAIPSAISFGSRFNFLNWIWIWI